MIDFTHTDGLIQQSKALHDLLHQDESQVTPEQLGEAMRKRERFMVNIDRELHTLATAKDAIDAYTRILRIERRTHTTDNKVLNDAYWTAVKKEKESSKPSRLSDL